MKNRGKQPEKLLAHTVQDIRNKKGLYFFKQTGEVRVLDQDIPVDSLPTIDDLQPLTEADLANRDTIRKFAKLLVTSYFFDHDDDHIHRRKVLPKFEKSVMQDPKERRKHRGIDIYFDMEPWPDIRERKPWFWVTDTIPANINQHIQLFQRDRYEHMPEYLRCCLVFANDSVIARALTIGDIMPAEYVDRLAKSGNEKFKMKREELIRDPKFQEFIRTEGDCVLVEFKKYYQKKVDKAVKPQAVELYREILGRLDGAYEDLKRMINGLENTASRLIP